YGDSAYTYAPMLKRVGDYSTAVQAYRYVLLTKFEDKGLEFQVKTEMAELILQAVDKMEPGAECNRLLDDAKKLAEEVQWGGQEQIWFWRTVVVLAHIEMVKGNKDGARKIIRTYMPGLDGAEELLRQEAIQTKNRELLKLSPMAECRYLMGSLYEDNGRDLVDKSSVKEGKDALKDALINYFSVMQKYPSSAWATEARGRVDGIVKFCKTKGWPEPKLPKIDMGRLALEQLKEARLLFSNNDFEAAADKYKEVLGVYSDRPDMVAAVGELARCYIEIEATEQNAPYYSRAIAGHVADRYCLNTNLYNEAGDTLLLVANAFESRGDRESAEMVLDAFFDKFNNHGRAVGAVLHRAGFALKSTNYVVALKYYQMVAEKYTNSARALDAVNFTAICHLRLGDYTNAAIWFSNYVGRLSWGIDQAVAIRSLGDTYQQMGRIVPAINEYNRLAYYLTNRGDKIEGTSENQTKKDELLEWALYQKGSCYARLKTPPERIGYYQTNAINSYLEFLKRYPKSEDKAPRVIGAVAMLYYVQNKPQQCDEMFQMLKEQWPTNEYTLNAVAIRVDNFLQLERTNDAIRAAGTMMDNPDAFRPEQFYRVAGIMLDGSMYEEAAKAYTHARRSANSNMWQIASMGLAKALLGLGQYAEAVKPVEELLARNPRSAYKIDANSLLSRCYAEAGKKETDPDKRRDLFNKSVRAMNVVRDYLLKVTKDKTALIEAELELATIQILKGDKDKAAATYLRAFMFGDPVDVRQRAVMESAFELGTPILRDLEKFEDVRDNCETYIKQFPQGRAIGRARDWLAWANARVGQTQQ
ncbi:MAG: tetratricopeptide repeat protein, partial [bacterium]